MQLEQAIHGYADGHRSLAASIDLPRDAKQLVLTLSDMSGRSMVPGFETYVTGYPVIGTPYFALSRTWYASEMERPGCVWTHTVFLLNSDLAGLRRLSDLRYVFRRPTDRHSWDTYSSPLQLSALQTSGRSPSSMPELSLTRATLMGLYLHPDRPVFIAATDAEVFEAFVLAIWSQQWASLRMSFAFCTGAIASRSLNSQVFDLQVIPQTSAREVRRQISNALFVPSETPTSEGAIQEEWLGIATTDLQGDHQLLQDIPIEWLSIGRPRGREAFAPLVELSVCCERAIVGDQSNIGRLIELVQRRFPNREEGRRLKVAIAGIDPWLGRDLCGNVKEHQILEALAIVPGGSAFDPESLDIEARCKELLKNDLSGSAKLLTTLTQGNINALGETLLLTLITNIDVSTAASLADAVPGIIATAARRNPAMATIPKLWSGSYDQQRDLFEAVTSARELSPEMRAQIVSAMLDARSDLVADRVLWRFGPDVVPPVLDWLAQDAREADENLKPGWRRALWQYPDVVLKWLSANPTTNLRSVALVVSALDPHSRVVRNQGANMWLEVLSSHSTDTYNHGRILLASFSLALAFDNPDRRAPELVPPTFDCVHDALAENRVANEVWEWFEGILPSLWWGWNWDKCERLRRGLVQRIGDYDWPATLLSAATQRIETFENLLTACSEVRGGKRILRQLAEESENRNSGISPERRTLLASRLKRL